VCVCVCVCMCVCVCVYGPQILTSKFYIFECISWTIKVNEILNPSYLYNTVNIV